jgi:hypothetical protein
MCEYQGKKVRLLSIEKGDYVNWWSDERKVVKKYCRTSGYREWLEEKKAREYEEKLIALRHKLDYQMKVYGQVDELDYQEFMWMLKNK